jgi:hypothetical protein
MSNTITIIENVEDFEMQDVIFNYGRPDTRSAEIVLNVKAGTLRTNDPGFSVPGRFRWEVPALTADIVNQLMHEIQPIAHRLVDADAADDQDAVKAAEAEIERLCDEDRFSDAEKVHLADLDVVVLYHGEPDEFGITAGTTDDELEAIATRSEERTARGSELGGVFCPELRDYLTGLRDALIENQGV